MPLKNANINTANYCNIKTQDYYLSHQHIGGCIDINVNITKPSNFSTPTV